MINTITPAKIVLVTLHICVELGVDLNKLLTLAGVPIQRLLGPEDSLTAQELVCLRQCAKELSNDPALGLHLGERLVSEFLDVLGVIMAAAPDFRSALKSLLLYSPLLTTLVHGVLEEEGDEALVTMVLSEEAAPISHHTAEVVVATVWNLRRLVKGCPRLRRVTFEQPAPPWADEYRRVFGEEAEIIFGAPHCSMVFERSSLDLPMARQSPDLFRHLREQAVIKLANQPQQETTTASVLRLIDEHLGKHLLDLHYVAFQMGLHPRTLQRQLQEEGVSFRRLYDGRRQQLACAILLEQSSSTTDIAAKLDFSEPTSFFRSFKEWTGLSPSEYRRRHKT